jgi:hypothetical protein
MADNPDLPPLIHKFSQESNQLLSMCRARGEASLLKRQLAVVLDGVKKIISCVGSEVNVEDVKCASVDLKNSVFEVCLTYLSLISQKKKEKKVKENNYFP